MNANEKIRKRAFISSTCNDLETERKIIDSILSENNIESVMSEKPDFDNDTSLGTHDACLKAIEGCDAIIVLVGGEYGKEYFGNLMKTEAEKLENLYNIKPSISWIELAYAIKLNKAIHILMSRDVYNDLKYYRANGTNNRLHYLKVRDTRIFSFIHYFNNKNNAYWIKFYRDVDEYNKGIESICRSIHERKKESFFVENSLDSIMPGFRYRSSRRIALINIYTGWYNYSDKLWILKSYFFQRGYEAEILDLELDEEIQMAYSRYDAVVVNVNAYNLRTVNNLFKDVKWYGDGCATFAIGSFAEYNTAYLKQHLGDVIDFVIPYSNVKRIFNYIEQIFDSENFPPEDSEKEIYEKNALLNSENLDEDMGILRIHPTIAYLRYHDDLCGAASIYTSSGCRKNCRTCGAHLYRNHSILQALDEDVIDQMAVLYNLGIRKIKINDEDIFCCSYVRAEKIFYIMHQHFPDMEFEINFLITDVTEEGQVNRINTFYNYGLRKIRYFLCQESDAKKALSILKKIIKKQKPEFQTEVVVYLGKYYETIEYYEQLKGMIKAQKNNRIFNKIKWDVRFENPKIVEGIIQIREGYRIYTPNVNYYDSKKPVMFYAYEFSNKKNFHRKIRDAMLEVYDMASRKDNVINPEIPAEVRNGFLNFPKQYNGQEISLKLYEEKAK